MHKKLQAFGHLLEILDQLRVECPWDRKQTLASLRSNTLEEVYELDEALFEENFEEIKKEIGDVLLHLVFYAKIADEQQKFDIADVLESLNQKLIRRHPHIFAKPTQLTEEQVKQNWEQIKLKEEQTQSVLAGVPKALPAITKAFRLQEKAQGVGFDFDTAQEAWQKVQEELQEFEAETELDRQEAELGDVLFSIINYARKKGLNPDTALERTNRTFIKRFQLMEQLMESQNQKFTQLNLAQMEILWQNAKTILKNK
jgi:XTP/dITP diphosphohydrolase